MTKLATKKKFSKVSTLVHVLYKATKFCLLRICALSRTAGLFVRRPTERRRGGVRDFAAATAHS